MACRKSASGVKISIRCAISAARDIRMSDLAPFPVLGTGGAGYICSHAVLALQDAGWPVAVIDNLSTGFRFAVPDDVPFYEGDVADEALLGRIFAEQGTRRSEEHTSELQSLMRISYAVFCLKKKKNTTHNKTRLYVVEKHIAYNVDIGTQEQTDHHKTKKSTTT